MAEVSLKYPAWGSAYVAAVLETDDASLAERVDQAEGAIFRRLQSIDSRPDLEELQALLDGIRGLRVLRDERLSRAARFRACLPALLSLSLD